MKTFSDGTYAKPEEEDMFIAAHVELALNPSGDFDGFYTMFPNYKGIEYMWPRRATGAQATEFIDWCGLQGPPRTGYESAFMHEIGFSDSGHRHDAPWGGYAMMLDHTDYKDYIVAKAVQLCNRTWWTVDHAGTKPAWQDFAGYVLVDLCQFYHEYDGGQEYVANTEEYNGVTLDDEHPRAYNCVSIIALIQAGLDTEFGTGAGRVFVMPNWGNLYFTDRGDDRTSDLLTQISDKWAMVQIAHELNTTNSSLDNGVFDLYSARLSAIMDTYNIKVLASFFDQSGNPHPSSLGKRLSAGMFYMTEHDNQYVSYKSLNNGWDQGYHSDYYEDNPMLRSGYLGVPRSAYTTDGRLYQREFERGTVYLWTKELKGDASTEKILTIPSDAYEMNEDGSLSPLSAGPYSLWSNDALVLITRYNLEAKNFTTASPVENWPVATGTPHWDELNEGVVSASDSDFIRTLNKDLLDTLAFPIPNDLKQICEFTFGLRLNSIADLITTGLELRLVNDNGEVFASNEIATSEASLINKQHSFRGLDLSPDQFQNDRVLVEVWSRDDAGFTNSKTLDSYVP